MCITFTPSSIRTFESLGSQKIMRDLFMRNRKKKQILQKEFLRTRLLEISDSDILSKCKIFCKIFSRIWNCHWIYSCKWYFDAKFPKKKFLTIFNWATVLEQILLKTCHIRKP